MIFTDVIRDVCVNPPINDVRSQAAYYPSSASVAVRDPATGLPKIIGASHGCLRSQYYQIKGFGITNPSSPEGKFKMEMGNKIQELIEDKLKLAGLWMGSEKRIFIPRMKLSGRLDIWAWDPESLAGGGPKIPVAIEVKSISGYQKGGITAVKNGKLMPKEDHVCQVLCYLDFLSQWPGFFHGQPPRIVLFEISREHMEWKEHVVYLGGEGHYGMPIAEDKRYAIVRNELGTFQLPYITVRGVYNRWLQLTDYLRKNELPPRDFDLQWSNEKIRLLAEKEVISKTDRTKVAAARKKDPEGETAWLVKGDWQCAYCDFKDLCWTGIKHEKPPVIKQELPSTGQAKPAPVTDPVGGV